MAHRRWGFKQQFLRFRFAPEPAFPNNHPDFGRAWVWRTAGETLAKAMPCISPTLLVMGAGAGTAPVALMTLTSLKSPARPGASSERWTLARICWRGAGAGQLSRFVHPLSGDFRFGDRGDRVPCLSDLAYFVAFHARAQIRLACGADRSPSGLRICTAGMSLPGRSFWSFDGVINSGLMRLSPDQPAAEVFSSTNPFAVVVTLAHAWAAFRHPADLCQPGKNRQVVAGSYAGDLGDGPVRRFLRITLPQLSLPGVIGAAILIFGADHPEITSRRRWWAARKGTMIANLIEELSSMAWATIVPWARPCRWSAWRWWLFASRACSWPAHRPRQGRHDEKSAIKQPAKPVGHRKSGPSVLRPRLSRLSLFARAGAAHLLLQQFRIHRPFRSQGFTTRWYAGLASDGAMPCASPEQQFEGGRRHRAAIHHPAVWPRPAP